MRFASRAARRRAIEPVRTRAYAGRRRAATPPQAPRVVHEWALVAATVALALVVHRHALRAYFSADDVALFEQVRGLAPQGAGPWRWLSLHLYVGSMFHAFGADPGPYHVVNWLVHGLDTGLVFAVARALGGGPLAATLAAGLFGASRLYLPALFQVATFGELAALAGACTALLLARREHLSARIGAALVFAAALLAKEVVALLPAVLLVTTGKPEPLAARARRAAPMLAVGLAYLAYLALAPGAASAIAGEAYATRLGVNLFHNLMTYTTWSADLARSIPGQVASIDEHAWTGGVWLVLLALIVAASLYRRTRVPAAGLAWFGLAIAPVLPLLHHTYAYYLYSPIAGLGIALGATLEAATTGRRWAWGVAAAGLLLYAWQSDRLITERLRARVPGSDVLLDPTLRKSEVARSLVTSFGAAIRGRSSVRAVIYQPQLGARYFDSGTGEALSAADAAVARHAQVLDTGMLDEGRVLMAFYPQLETVFVASRWLPEYRDLELFAVGPGRTLVSMGTGPIATRRTAAALITSGHPEQALELDRAAVAAWPANPRLRLDLAILLRETGDRSGAIGQLHELLRLEPTNAVAASARQLLAELEP